MNAWRQRAINQGEWVVEVFAFGAESAVGGWDWRVRGRCRDQGIDWEIFFAPSGREPAAVRRRREAEAKALCHGCPVVRQCRDHAVEFDEKHGIWGGMTVDEIATVARDARSA